MGIRRGNSGNRTNLRWSRSDPARLVLSSFFSTVVSLFFNLPSTVSTLRMPELLVLSFFRREITHMLDKIHITGKSMIFNYNPNLTLTFHRCWHMAFPSDMLCVYRRPMSNCHFTPLPAQWSLFWAFSDILYFTIIQDIHQSVCLFQLQLDQKTCESILLEK